MSFDSKKLLKTLTAGRGAILAPHIEAYQSKANFPPVWNIEIQNYKLDDGHFHPSSDAFATPLQMWQARQGLAQKMPISPALRRTFDVGHMWHGYLQAMLIEMGLIAPENVERYITKEVIGNYGPAIGAGTGDLVDINVPGHGVWLFDIKTMNKTEFEAGASPYTFTKWNAQVNCYMDWFETDKARILAVCKDSPHAFREYEIKRDDNLLTEIYNRWSYTANCLAANIMPQDDYEVDPMLLNRGDSADDEIIAATSKA